MSDGSSGWQLQGMFESLRDAIKRSQIPPGALRTYDDVLQSGKLSSPICAETCQGKNDWLMDQSCTQSVTDFSLAGCLTHYPEIVNTHHSAQDHLLTLQTAYPECKASIDALGKFLIRLSQPRFQPPSGCNSADEAERYITDVETAIETAIITSIDQGELGIRCDRQAIMDLVDALTNVNHSAPMYVSVSGNSAAWYRSK